MSSNSVRLTSSLSRSRTRRSGGIMGFLQSLTGSQIDELAADDTPSGMSNGQVIVVGILGALAALGALKYYSSGEKMSRLTAIRNVFESPKFKELVNSKGLHNVMNKIVAIQKDLPGTGLKSFLLLENIARGATKGGRRTMKKDRRRRK